MAVVSVILSLHYNIFTVSTTFVTLFSFLFLLERRRRKKLFGYKSSSKTTPRSYDLFSSRINTSDIVIPDDITLFLPFVFLIVCLFASLLLCINLLHLFIYVGMEKYIFVIGLEEEGRGEINTLADIRPNN